MPEGSQQNSFSLIIYAVVIALFVWRMMRPMRVSFARIWVRPALLIVFGVLAVYFEQLTTPAPPLLLAAVIVGGAAVGIPLGILRGRHSEVKATERPGIYYVHSSPFVTIIWLLAFLARAGIRYFVPQASHSATIWTTALLAFATAAIAASAVIVHKKLQAVIHQRPA